MEKTFYRPTLQTKFNEGGNCLSAVIATLFDVGIDDVPFFGDDDEEWAFGLSKWFSEKFNKYSVLIKLSDLSDSKVFCESMIITAINSPNPNVDRHAVISKHNRIIFDPMIGEVDLELTSEMDPSFFIIGEVLVR